MEDEESKRQHGHQVDERALHNQHYHLRQRPDDQFDLAQRHGNHEHLEKQQHQRERLDWDAILASRRRDIQEQRTGRLQVKGVRPAGTIVISASSPRARDESRITVVDASQLCKPLWRDADQKRMSGEGKGLTRGVVGTSDAPLVPVAAGKVSPPKARRAPESPTGREGDGLTPDGAIRGRGQPPQEAKGGRGGGRSLPSLVASPLCRRSEQGGGREPPDGGVGEEKERPSGAGEEEEKSGHELSSEAGEGASLRRGCVNAASSRGGRRSAGVPEGTPRTMERSHSETSFVARGSLLFQDDVWESQGEWDPLPAVVGVARVAAGNQSPIMGWRSKAKTKLVVRREGLGGRGESGSSMEKVMLEGTGLAAGDRARAFSRLV